MTETIKQRLARLHAEREAIDHQIIDCYRESANARWEDKAVPDWIAATLSDPLKTLTYPVELLGVSHADYSFVKQRDDLMLSLVAVRPCDKSLNGKTFIGVYLGDVASFVMATFNRQTGVLSLSPARHNPTFWIPELKRIVFGYESWWTKIKSASEIPEITDETIANTWYVKALREKLNADKQG